MVVTGGGAVKRSPTVRVLDVHVAAKLHEELDDVEVAGADGVVEGGDALVIVGAGVGHLARGLPDEVQLTLQ